MKPKRQLSEDRFDRKKASDGVAGGGRFTPRQGHRSELQVAQGNRSGDLSRGEKATRRPVGEPVASFRGAGLGRVPAINGFPGTPRTGASTPMQLARSTEAGPLPVQHSLTPRRGNQACQVLTQAGSFDGDIRCASLVCESNQASVWCGERDGSVTVRDPQTAEIKTLIKQDEILLDYIWSIMQVGTMVWVGTSSGRLRVYSADKQRLEVERIRHSGGIYTMVSLGNFVYTASNDFSILEWDKISGDTTGKTFKEHRNQVRCLCACGNKLVSGGDDKDIYIYHAAKGEVLKSFHQNDGILAVAYVPERECRTTTSGVVNPLLWAADSSGAIVIYNLTTYTVVQDIREHKGPVNVLLRQQNLMLSGSTDRTVKVWEAAYGTLLQTLDAHASHVMCIAPVVRSVSIRLWSVSGDKVVIPWCCELKGPADDWIEAVQDEAERIHLKSQEVGQEITAARDAEKALQKELTDTRSEAEAERQRWRDAEQELLGRIAELEGMLRVRDSELARSQGELEDALIRSQELETSEAQFRMDLENERAARDSIANDLTASQEQVQELLSQLKTSQDRVQSMEQDLTLAAEESNALRDELHRSLASGEEAKSHIDMLQAQINEHEQLKAARLSFVSEVWGLYKRISESRKSAQAVARVHAPKAGLQHQALQADADHTYEGVSRSREHCAMIVSRYMTDDEKLHLGIPLSMFESDESQLASPSVLRQAASSLQVSGHSADKRHGMAPSRSMTARQGAVSPEDTRRSVRRYSPTNSTANPPPVATPRKKPATSRHST